MGGGVDTMHFKVKLPESSRHDLARVKVKMFCMRLFEALRLRIGLCVIPGVHRGDHVIFIEEFQ